MKLLWLVVVFLSLSSCATLFNRPSQRLRLYTNEATQLVVDNDTLAGRKQVHDFVVKRSRASLPLEILGDSMQRNLEVVPYNSFAYHLNFSYPHLNILIGWLVDRKSPKRYAYPTHLSFDLKDSLHPYYDYNLFNIPKQLIKVTPAKIFSIHNSSIEVAYERPTGKDFSTQLMMSYLFPNSIYQISSRFKENTKGYRIAFEERFFHKKAAPFGSYIALELDFLKKRAFHEEYFYNKAIEEPYLDTFLVHSQYLSANLKFGYQKEYGKLFVDFYAGIGRRNRTIHHLQRDNPADEIHNHTHFDFKYNRILEGRHTTVSIPLNFRMGWRF